MNWAMGFLVLSGLLGMVGYFLGQSAMEELGGSAYFAEQAAGNMQLATAMSAASWILFYLFLVLWPTGYIVKAISFLPGKSD